MIAVNPLSAQLNPECVPTLSLKMCNGLMAMFYFLALNSGPVISGNDISIYIYMLLPV